MTGIEIEDDGEGQLVGDETDVCGEWLSRLGYSGWEVRWVSELVSVAISFLQSFI